MAQLKDKGPVFKRKQTNNGTLRTPLEFYESTSNSPEPGDSSLVKVFECFGEVYNPSIKDISIMNAQGVSSGVTVKIRNQDSFLPTLDHTVKVYDKYYRYIDYRIIDISPNDYFIKLILTGSRYDG